MNYVTSVLHAATAPLASIVSLKQFKKIHRQGAQCFAAFITSEDIVQLNAVQADETKPPDPSLVQPDKLNALLDEYKEVFEPLTGLGPDLGIGHTIELEPGKQPPYSRPYRLSQLEQQELTSRVSASSKPEKGRAPPASVQAGS